MSALATATLKIGMGNWSRTVLQAFTLLLVARELGADGYGLFAGLVALSLMFAPFGSGGFDFLMVREGALRPERFPDAWARSLVVTLVFGTVFVGVASLLAFRLFPEGTAIRVVISIAVADIVLERLTFVAFRAFQASERMGTASLIHVLTAIMRLGAAFLLLTLFSGRLEEWSALYLASSFVTAALATAWSFRELGMPRFVTGDVKSEPTEASYFCLSAGTDRFYQEMDKSMLVWLAHPAAAGIYTVAFRLVDMIVSPVNAFIVASLTGSFASGQGGTRAFFDRFRSWLISAAAYTTAMALLLYFLANWLVNIFGASYSDLDSVARVLAPLIVLIMIRNFLMHACLVTGRAKARVLVQVGGVTAKFGINLVLIPMFGWRGAAACAYLVDALLVFCLIAILAWRQKSRQVTGGLVSGQAIFQNERREK